MFKSENLPKKTTKKTVSFSDDLIVVKEKIEEKFDKTISRNTQETDTINPFFDKALQEETQWAIKNEFSDTTGISDSVKTLSIIPVILILSSLIKSFFNKE